MLLMEYVATDLEPVKVLEKSCDRFGLLEETVLIIAEKQGIAGSVGRVSIPARCLSSKKVVGTNKKCNPLR